MTLSRADISTLCKACLWCGVDGIVEPQAPHFLDLASSGLATAIDLLHAQILVGAILSHDLNNFSLLCRDVDDDVALRTRARPVGLDSWWPQANLTSSTGFHLCYGHISISRKR